jgi:hypothetical protein
MMNTSLTPKKGSKNMFRKISLTVAVSAALSIPGHLAGDERKKEVDSPEAVVEKALKALKEDRLEDFAGAMHPEALKRLKALLTTVVEAAAKEGQSKQVLRLFDGVASADALKKLDDVQFFVRFLRGVTRLKPELKQALGGAEARVLGHVMEGKDTAHVVYRMTVSVGGAKMTKMDVTSLRKSEVGWRMLLSTELEGIATILKQKFGDEKE